MGLRRAPRAEAPSWVEHAGDPRPAAVAGNVDDDWDAAGPLGATTRLQATAARWSAVALWVVIGLALVLGLVNCAQPSSSGPPPETVHASPAAPPGGCAELAVAAWVAGDADLLADGTNPAISPAGPDRQAVRTHTAAVTGAVSPDRWGYLVAAQVQERDPDSGQWRDLGLQYFTVTLVESGGGCHGWSPVAFPMQVAAPPPAGDVSLPYTIPLASSGTELSSTLEAFFGGMLAAGEMERYVAPGVSVPAVVPAPYRDVVLTELRAWSGTSIGRDDQMPPDGTTVRLLASVRADGAPLPLAYPVTVGVRGGRWEVVAIDPLVGAPAQAPAGSPGPAGRHATPVPVAP